MPLVTLTGGEYGICSGITYQWSWPGLLRFRAPDHDMMTVWPVELLLNMRDPHKYKQRMIHT